MIDRDQLTDALAVFDQAQPDPDDEMLAIQVAVVAIQAWLDFPAGLVADGVLRYEVSGSKNRADGTWGAARRLISDWVAFDD